MNFTPEEDLRPFKIIPSIMPELPIDTMISEKRAERFKQVLMRRTRRLVAVVEDCHDQHNATAIIRSCDAFGIDEVHIVSSINKFKVNKQVSKGTHHFMEVKIHKSIEAAYAQLRQNGFKIFASDLTSEKVLHTEELYQEYCNHPIAIVFGEESGGLSAKASQLADGHFLIPMAGFAQSLNVSVALAVTIYALREHELCSDASGDLTVNEQITRYTRWVRRKRGIAVDQAMDLYKGKEIEVEIFDSNISQADSE